jgi:hypothetical protein
VEGSQTQKRGMNMDKTTMEAKMYQTLCTDFGLKPEWLGKTVKDTNGKTYTIAGLNPRSTKFPVVMKEGIRMSVDYLTALMTNSVDGFKQKQQSDFEKKVQKELKQARANFPNYSKSFNIPESWLDKTFRNGRKVYTIVGLSSDWRYPVVGTDEKGKITYFSPELVRQSMGAEAA